MTTKQTLEAARGLIAAKEKWIRGDWTNGYAYCALGAINATEGNCRGARKALKQVLPRCKSNPLKYVISTIFASPRIWDYNDRNSHDCVIAAFDRAIEKEES